MNDPLEDALTTIAAKIEAEIVSVVAYETGIDLATRAPDGLLAGNIDEAKNDCMALIRPLVESLIESAYQYGREEHRAFHGLNVPMKENDND